MKVQPEGYLPGRYGRRVHGWRHAIGGRARRPAPSHSSIIVVCSMFIARPDLAFPPSDLPHRLYLSSREVEPRPGFTVATCPRPEAQGPLTVNLGTGRARGWFGRIPCARPPLDVASVREGPDRATMRNRWEQRSLPKARLPSRSVTARRRVSGMCAPAGVQPALNLEGNACADPHAGRCEGWGLNIPGSKVRVLRGAP